MTTSFEIQELESKSDLQRHLGQSEGVTALLGTKAEAPRRFFALKLIDQAAPLIGVICSFHGIKPALVMGTGIVFVGHDSTVTGLDVRTGQVLLAIPLKGPFYDFIAVSGGNVIVIQELGALALSERGAIRWTRDTLDVLTRFQLNAAGELHLSTMDGSIAVFDAASGRTKWEISGR